MRKGDSPFFSLGPSGRGEAREHPPDEYFVAIAEERQITAAAARLHMSQPPLSRELARMERELGVRLVVRGPRSVSSRRQESLHRAAARCWSSRAPWSARWRASARAAWRGLAGGLAGGVCASDAMAPFVDDYPNVRFDVHEGNTFEVIDMLNRGIVELGFVRTPFERGQLSCRDGAPVPMAAVMPARFAVGERPDVVTLAELSGVPLVIYRRYQALLSERFHQAGASLVVACLNDDPAPRATTARRGFRRGSCRPDVRDRQHGGASPSAWRTRHWSRGSPPGAGEGPQAVPAGERFLACFVLV